MAVITCSVHLQDGTHEPQFITGPGTVQSIVDDVRSFLGKPFVQFDVFLQEEYQQVGPAEALRLYPECFIQVPQFLRLVEPL